MIKTIHWVLIAAGLLFSSIPAVTQGVDFTDELDRYFESGAEPLNKAEREQLTAAQSQLESLRRQLIEHGGEFTEEIFEKFVSKMEPLVIIVTRLEKKDKRWAEAQAEAAANKDPGEGSGSISPGVDAGPGAPLDLDEFYRMQQTFLSLRVAQGRSEAKGMEPRQWWQLANRYWMFSEKKFTPDEPKRAAYILRARYMCDLCRLKGAALRYNDGDHDGMLDVYRSTIEELQALDRILKVAGRSIGQPELIEKLPPAPEAYRNLHIIGAENWFEHDLRTEKSREIGGSLAQVTTSTAVRRLLDTACPWGVETYTLLADAGMVNGLDLSILSPFSWKKEQKLAVCPLGPATVPRFIREQMEAIRSGGFEYRGKTVNVDWAIVPDEPAYSLWVTSPRVFNVSPAALLTLAATAATVSQAGLLDIGVTFLGSALNVALADSYGADCPVAMAVGVAPDAMVYDVKLTNLKLKRGSLSYTKLAKGIGIQALAVIEEQELKNLFEGYRPCSDAARAYIGKPLTYVGNPLPPILLRAFLVGIEKVPDDEYRRIWVVTKYWQLDPRGLATIDGSYDLTRLIASSGDRIAAYLKGDDAVQRSLWKLLPDSGTEPVGTRLAITDLTPPLQRLTIELPPELWKSWSENLPKDRTLVAVVDSRESDWPVPAWGEFKHGRAILGFHDPVQHPVSQDNSWRPTKILTEYPVRIIEVGKTLIGGITLEQASYNLDPTVTTEKGRFVARFRGSRGRRPSGKVTSIESGAMVIALHHIFKGDDLGSQAGPLVKYEGDLLPRMLIFNDVWAGKESNDIFAGKESKEFVLGSYYDHMEIEGGVGPASMGWYRFEIVVESNDGKHKFQAYGLAESPGGAAAFAAKIPLSVGRHKITVSCDGFEPVSASVVREKPEPANVDIAKQQGYLREYQVKRNSEPARSGRYWEYHFDMLFSKLSLARDYAKIEQYINARTVLQEVAREIPQGRMSHPSLKDDQAGIHKDLMYTLPDICYHLGDAKTMAEAGKWRLDQEITKRIKKVQSGSDPPRYLLAEARDLAEFIERCILLDADSVMGPGFIARLDAQHQSLLKQAGVFNPQYDGKYRFRYGQEVRK